MINEGSLSTANGPAVISITGNYTENSSAILNIQVAGTDPATPAFDQFSVSGTATLAGTLNLSLGNGFLPDLTQSFKIISAGTLSGAYATVNNVSIDGHALFSTQYSGTALTLQGTSIVVNSTGDGGQSGSGTPHTGNTVNGVPETTLRSAIQYVNNTAGTSYIFFDIPTSDAGYSSSSGGYWSIAPTSALPAITEDAIIDATSQPGYSTHPVIELDGANAGATVAGLSLVAGATTVRGLAINRFGRDGIDTSGVGNTLVGNYLGTDVTGQTALGNGQYGILVNFGTNTTIGGTAAADRNVIGGNASAGILVNDGVSNLIEGNYLGVTAAGTGELGNGTRGISLYGSSTGNTIGGTTAAARNVISGNSNGVLINDAGDSGNLVEGNYIGLNAAGNAALPNSSDGILVDTAATNNTIGGTAAAAANVISGNGSYGIQLDGPTTTGNVIENNDIGTQTGGSGTLLNSSGALDITTGAAVLAAGSFTGNVVNQGSLSTFNGPTTLSITGNYTENSSAILNVQVAGTASFDQLSVSGTATVAGTLDLSLDNGFLPQYTQSFGIISAGTLSGTYATVNNALIDGRGQFSTQYSTTALTLQGSAIVVNSTGDSGQSSSGTPDTGNTVNGAPEVTLRSAIQYANHVSGTSEIFFDIPTSDAGYNSASGGYWSIAPHSNLPIITHSVILDASTQSGYSAHPVIEINGTNAGIDSTGLNLTASNSTIRGFAINRFGGNGAPGIEVGTLFTNTTTGDSIIGNYIGTDVLGTTALANISLGIVVSGNNNTIGGSAGAATRNLVSGNTGSGIAIEDTLGNNLVEGNYIGLNAAGTGNLGNSTSGIVVNGGTDNTIGGTTAADRNVISGNGYDGIDLIAGADDNLVEGNYIGTDYTGNVVVGNSNVGMVVDQGGGGHNTIGGLTSTPGTGAGNVISGNSDANVSLLGVMGGWSRATSSAWRPTARPWETTATASTSPAGVPASRSAARRRRHATSSAATAAAAPTVLAFPSITAPAATWWKAITSAPTSPARRPSATASAASGWAFTFPAASATTPSAVRPRLRQTSSAAMAATASRSGHPDHRQRPGKQLRRHQAGGSGSLLNTSGALELNSGGAARSPAPSTATWSIKARSAPPTGRRPSASPATTPRTRAPSSTCRWRDRPRSINCRSAAPPHSPARSTCRSATASCPIRARASRLSTPALAAAPMRRSICRPPPAAPCSVRNTVRRP